MRELWNATRRKTRAGRTIAATALITALLLAAGCAQDGDAHETSIDASRAFGGEAGEADDARVVAATAAPPAPSPAAPPATVSTEEALAAAYALEEAFASVADRVNPAVVQIRTLSTVRAPGGQDMPDFFRWFFGPQNPPDQSPRDDDPDGRRALPQRPGLGSGVIIRADGYIATNEHVVRDADEVEVRLFDGRTLDAEIVGSDPSTDVAVIRVDASGLEALPWGDANDLRVGQWVLAFGSPLSASFNNSVTTGIVSALGRFDSGQSGSGDSTFREYVQTDAAINPGNSGGPLVDLRGRMVGMNTAIFSRSGGFQGIGLAIPVDTVRSVTEQLITDGRVRRARLGVMFGPVTAALRDALDLPPGAAQVTSVQPDSAAEAGGIRAGDVIVALDGNTLSTNHLELGAIVTSKRPGDRMTVTIDREGKRRTLEVTLKAADGEPVETARSGGAADDDTSLDERLGITVADITPERIERFRVEGEPKGVVVIDVDQTSDAFREAGLQRGLIITEVDRKPIESVDDMREVYDDIDPGDSFLVRVRTADGSGSWLTALTKPNG